MICSVIGCGKSHYGKGFCKAHYLRLKNHGDPLGGGTSPNEARDFLINTVLSYEGDDCLIWPYSKDPKGYGRLWENGKATVVSRIVCAELHGKPPSPKYEAAHNCGNGHFGCVNPHHLEWKTRVDNQADKLIHGTHNRGERHGSSKLTEEQVREILRLKGIVSQRKLASRFGVSNSTIAGIHRGASWGWLLECDVSASPPIAMTS